MMSKPTAAMTRPRRIEKIVFRNVVAAQSDEGGKGKDHQGEFFVGAKLQRKNSERRREQGEQNDRDRATDEGLAIGGGQSAP